jgi:Cu/Zn superoxide dismutase
MNWKNLVWVFVFVGTGCVSPQTTTKQAQRFENVRLAQAQVTPSPSSSAVKGTVNFEQMPNSMIVIHRIEGLTPKGTYQVFVKDSGDCNSKDLKSAHLISQVRANKSGVAENTFKTEDFSVSGQQPVVGRTIVITTAPSGSKKQTPDPIACGPVEPFARSAASQ